MAKKGGRTLIGFVCPVCKSRNYLGSKNTALNKDKYVFNKFCKHCRKVTEHTENSKLD